MKSDADIAMLYRGMKEANIRADTFEKILAAARVWAADSIDDDIVELRNILDREGSE